MRMINLLEILTRWLRKIWTDLVTVLSYLIGLNKEAKMNYLLLSDISA